MASDSTHIGAYAENIFNEWHSRYGGRGSHKLRHFLFTWLKTQGIDDALIQRYSGHERRQAIEIYSRIALADAQKEYQGVIERFPV